MGKTKSIMTDDMEHCYVCGSSHVECHHIYFGTANRKISDAYGCVIGLCNFHHTGSEQAVHFNKNLDMALKKECQRRFQKQYPNEDFMKLFGKNYL